MSEKLSLNLEDLEVVSFALIGDEASIALPGGGGASWPAICTCIGICQPTEDIYCSGGCPKLPYAY